MGESINNLQDKIDSYDTYVQNVNRGTVINPDEATFTIENDIIKINFGRLAQLVRAVHS